MMKPTLVVMAAGLGSRYGGLKQIDAVGPNGEIIIDYSIYDAIKSGFGKVVFIIKKEIEEPFKKAIGDRISKLINTEYAYQEIDGAIPSGYAVPPERTKPWGTAHAVLCCKNIVKTPFAVINADDFYGPTSFTEMSGFLSALQDTKNPRRYAMVGFILENTLTDHGTVSRGVCSVSDEGLLANIQERTKIQKFADDAKYTEDGENWIPIPHGSIVSMNLWGLDPSVFEELESNFAVFLKTQGSIPKAEYFLPSVINDMLIKKKATVQVLTSKEKWYGITYREDKPAVVNAINSLIEKGVYPNKLWQ